MKQNARNLLQHFRVCNAYAQNLSVNFGREIGNYFAIQTQKLSLITESIGLISKTGVDNTNLKPNENKYSFLFIARFDFAMIPLDTATISLRVSGVRYKYMDTIH